MGFGEKLQREREMRGITLDEIAKATKIGTRSLRALEQEDFNKLPGGIFNKGFVRAYARYLGIDEEQAVADYLAAVDEPESTPNAVDNEQLKKIEANWKPLPVEGEGSSTSFRFPWLGLTIVVLIVAVVVSAWRFGPQVVEWLKARHQSQAQQTESTQHTTEAAYESAPAASQSQTTATAPVTPAPETPSSAASPETAAATADTASEQTAGQGFELQIRAAEDSWVSIKADGKTVQLGIMKAGQQQTFRAHDKVILTAGNAGGVEVSFNGRPQPSLGAAKKVRTVIFTPKGMQAPATE